MKRAGWVIRLVEQPAPRIQEAEKPRDMEVTKEEKEKDNTKDDTILTEGEIFR